MTNTATNSYLVEYYEKCKSGEIIVGKELMATLEMLMRDMESPLYQFDTAKAHKRIKFIESECRHSIAPFAGMPFLLELWEKAFIEAVYGFKVEIRGEWLRRYNRALLLIARKNGKTTFCSALGNAEFFCGSQGTNILCASNDYEQAGLIFDEINNMREESPKLRRVSRKNIKGIFMGNPKQRKKTGKYSVQNKAKIKKLSIKTGGKEGRNVDFAVVDEVHEMKDNSLVMPIRQSMSTKPEPLLIEITTEGNVRDGYLDGLLVEARKVLKGESTDDRWLVWLYSQDSESEIWQNEKSWVKSNPNLGVSKRWDYLDGLVEHAKTNSGDRAMMLAKDFNLPQSASTAWMQEAEIINTATFDIEEFRGAYYIGGDDFAETTDLCASVMLFMRPGDKTIYLCPHFWIPETKLINSPDDANYEQWAKDGYLSIVDGNIVDSSVVADWKWQMYKEYGVIPYKDGYDNRFAKDYIAKFKEYFGEETELINVPQDSKCLNNPMRHFEADLRSKLVNYNNNYGLLYCLKNTGFKADSIGRIQPCKMHTTKRIDGTAACLCAYAVYEWNKSEYHTLIGG